jgi:hypothetical protein
MPALARGAITRSSSAGRDSALLNIGLMFGVLSRLTRYFIPHAFTNIPNDVGWQAYGTIINLSFVTLTLFD